MADRRYIAVIPAYNAASFVGETIASILTQSVPPQRVIVVDDGSSDDTEAVVRALGERVAYVRQENTGPGGATTRGIAMVDAPLVATCDADDLWVPDKMARQIALLESDPDASAVFGRIADFRDDPSHANHAGAYDGWLRSTMVVRTEAALATGPIIDPKGGVGDMVDWLARLREGGHKTILLLQVVTLRRIHAGSLTNRNRVDVARGYLDVVKASLARRRQQERDK